MLMLLLFLNVSPGRGDNAPPVLTMDREWHISSDEGVGSVVTRVRGTDSEGDPLVYGLEHIEDYNVGIPVDPRPLPFTIDKDSGVVYTNESLADRAGKNMYLYVTVSDGQLTQKSAVRVTILEAGKGGQGGRGPGRPPPPPPGGRTRLGPVLSPPPPRPAAPSTTTSSTTTTTSTTTATPQTQPTSPPPVAPPPSPTAADLALTIVPVAIVCLMFGVAGVTAFLFRKKICRYKKKSKKEEMKKSENLRENGIVMHQWNGPRAHNNRYEAWDTTAPNQPAPSAPEKPSDRWEYPRHHLKVFNILGEGCFGQVWRCEAKNIDGNDGLTIVAVKTLKENAGDVERNDLLQELKVMKMLDPHPNVVRLLGCCTDKDPFFVIMEYVNKGKLQSFLRNSRAQRSYDNLHGKSNNLTSRNLTSFCYQVARGMQYLSSKGIIHRDLAARNILIADDLTCKVADFGFARDVTATHVYERKSEGRLPIRWMAPESLYDNVFSFKSDVWSLGVLIWEVVTLGSTPYPGLSAGEVMKRVRDGYRLDKPEHCRRELYNIMYYCWDQDPSNRPDFPEVVSLLEQLLLSETDYIELQMFPDHSYYNIVSLSGEKL